MRIGIVFVLVCLAAAVVWLVKTIGASAREKPGAVETYLARRARSLVTPSAVKSLSNPLEATVLAIAEGRDHFADHCAVCHANNGSGKTEMGGNMYPPAPDMRSGDTQKMSDGELFHVVRDGVRFTGMPGWGGADEDNWKLVLFVRHLPQLSQKELELMREVNGQGAEQ